MPEQTPAPAAAGAQQSDKQKSLTAWVALVALGLLLAWLVFILVASLVGLWADAAWSFTGWLLLKSAKITGKLALGFSLVTVAIGVFSKLYKDEDKLAWMVGLVGASFLLGFFAWFRLTGDPGHVGNIALKFGELCADAGKGEVGRLKDELRLACVDARVDSLFLAILAWLIMALATSLGLRLAQLKNALENMQAWIEGKFS